MKSLIKFLALIIALNMTSAISTKHASAQQGGVSFEVFYNELSPYGEWVDHPGYGYVWIPLTGPDFAPYSSDGHWVLTNYGWTWVSDYSWGWAPFHYGRWDYDDYYGWFWVPDNEWGPAWVSWRRSPSYYGWAPMRPGISLSVSFGRQYTVPNERWIFVRNRDISRPDISHYYINRTNNNTIIRNSSLINRTYTDQNRHSTYVSGPDRADVQKITGRTIQPVAIHDNDRPSQTLINDQLHLYRPQVQKTSANGQTPAPPKVMRLNDVRPAPERNAGNQRRNENLPPNANPPGSKAAGGQPRIVNPPDKNKSNQQPSQPQIAKPPDNMGRGQQPRIVNPPDENKNMDQQSKPTNVRSPNNRRQSPQTTTPPKDKGKGPDSQPPKSDRQKQDGTNK